MARALFAYTAFTVMVLVLMVNMQGSFTGFLENKTVNGSSVSFDMNNNISRSGDSEEAGIVLHPVADLTNVSARVADESVDVTRATLYNGTDATAPVLQRVNLSSTQTATFTASFIPGRKYLITGDGNGSQFRAAEDNQTVLPETSTDINVSTGFLE